MAFAIRSNNMANGNNNKENEGRILTNSILSSVRISNSRHCYSYELNNL